jgi:cysteinyl-tRNA synthetase
MSLKILGEGFDIHGGGADLIFPHHENEIAQAVGAGKQFARYWIHNGMVNVDGEKMSKSLGNFVTLGDVLEQYGPRAFRLLCLQTHYRRQMEIADKELSDAQKAVEKIDALLRRGRNAQVPDGEVGDVASFRDAMDDDFDTPAAVAGIFTDVNSANIAIDQGRLDDAAGLVSTVKELCGVLGLEVGHDEVQLDDDIAMLVSERDAARAAKDFARSDQIRDDLLAQGIVLEDTPQGTVWRRA